MPDGIRRAFWHDCPVSVAQHCPHPRELDDLELLLSGALAPQRNFDVSDPGITLSLPDELAETVAAGGAVELVDPEGLPLARYSADELTPLATPAYGPFRRLHLPPAEARRLYAGALLVPVAAPLTDSDLATIRAEAGGRDVVLLALNGTGTPQDVSPVGLVRATLAAATLLDPSPVDPPPADPVRVEQRAPASDPSPVEQRAPAADPSPVEQRAPASDPSPADPLRVEQRAPASGQSRPRVHVVAAPLPSHGDAAYDHELGQRVAAAYASDGILAVSGEGEWPAEVARIVDQDQPSDGEHGFVVFFTGLSGSGKSTLARALHDLILEDGRRTVTSLDGDVVRRNLSAGLTFSKEDRETNIRRIGWVAAEIARHRGIAICSPIAPFDATRRQVRAMVEDAGGEFVLVHVSTPLEECERRDRKGLYARARAGEIPEFTGISSPYDEPTDAAVAIDTTGRTIEDCLADLLPVLPWTLVEPVETTLADPPTVAEPPTVVEPVETTPGTDSP